MTRTSPIGWWTVIATLITFLVASAAAPWRWVKVVSIAIVLVTIGIGTARFQEMRLATPMVGSVVNTTLTAQIMRIEKRDNGSLRYLLDIRKTERPTLRFAPERVLITQRSTETEKIEVGDIVMARVRLLPASGPVMPGSYDFGFNAFFRGIGGNGFVMGKLAVLDKSEKSLSFSIAVERMRTRLAEHVRSRIGGVEGEIAAALIAGVRSGIPDEINAALRQTGLAHVLSISGLHMAMVTGFAMAGFRVLLALIPSLASRYPIKKIAAVLALLAASFYLVLSGAEVAARRSFIMVAIMLIAVIFDRAAITMRNVALSALVIFAISPHQILGPSFQMSYAATIALIAAYGAWARGKRSGAWWLAPRGSVTASIASYIAALSMTAIVAGGATTIFGAYHFYRVSPLSLPTNLLVMPIVSIFMPVGVLAMIMTPLGLDAPFFYVMGEGIGMMNAIALWLGSLSPDDAVGRIPERSLVALTIACLALTLFRTRLVLLSVPVGLLGLVWLFQRTEPDILISENGKLVGARLGNGTLALNNGRGSAFTIDNWRYAFQVTQIVKPVSSTKTSSENGFRCQDRTCYIDLGGYAIWTVDSAQSARGFCDTADLLIITADATAKNICGNSSRAQLVTLRDLARRGAVGIHIPRAHVSREGALDRLQNRDAKLPLNIVHAINEPYRVWHQYRQYSREARGLPPFQPKARLNAGSGQRSDTTASDHPTQRNKRVANETIPEDRLQSLVAPSQ
ncbi:ComEC/Rec2 family competence protein [Limoniibacter endophyticus]|uniref:ComEC/Rec2 family competence protein n=1 Tax=Limoniibacter endophyticus TaxID=1565040 RepID=UPI0016740AB0|nr:ComEC/Rec2 family competence protein [Limoniibacter endophyticus]